MTRIEHPFAKVCRAVLKERYPDKASVISDDFLPNPDDMPEDAVNEVLRRYFSGKKPVIHTPFLVRPASPTPEQQVKRTITYV
jgi:hypothetical protein